MTDEIERPTFEEKQPKKKGVVRDIHTREEVKPKKQDFKRDDSSVEIAQSEEMYIRKQYADAKVAYDVGAMQDFVDMVFHAPLLEDEEPTFYFGSVKLKSPHLAYGQMEEDFLDRCEKATVPASLYYCVASLNRDRDGQLRNKYKNFSSLRVLVLDDIGTKIPVERIPEAAKPTYILESSKGNYQYGYVFEDPIRNLDHANALITLFYSSRNEEERLTDSGGAQACKRVRFPQGVHGKADSKDFLFRSVLTEKDGPRYTPQSLLDAFGFPVQWGDVEENTDKYTKKSATTSVSAWSGCLSDFATTDIVTDPLLEFIDSKKMLLSGADSAGWFPVECPRCTQHTDENDKHAWYNPIGYGDDRFARHFKCFHDHNGNPPDFSEFVSFYSTLGGPERVPRFDPAADLVRRFAFCTSNNTVWDVQATPPYMYSHKNAFNMEYNQPVKHFAKNPKTGEIEAKNEPVHKFFDWHPQRVIVRGSTSDKEQLTNIVRDRENNLYINTFRQPDYGRGTIDMRHVEKFLEFIEYLFPVKEECAVFKEWLAAKIQKPSHRGWGLLMYTPTGGTGRGTLKKVIRTLMGEANTEEVDFDIFKRPVPFNEHLTSSICFVDEASTDNAPALTHAQSKIVAERLKEEIDTTVRSVTINHKTRAKEFNVKVTTSFIIACNNVINIIDDTDRRMFCMQNPITPASEQFFIDLYKWLDEVDEFDQPVWRDHVGRWLLKQPVDFGKMNGRAPTTTLKSQIQNASKSALDLAIKTIFVTLKSPFISPAHLEAVLSGPLELRLNLPDHNAQAIIKKAFKDAATGQLPKPIKCTIGSEKVPMSRRFRFHPAFASHEDVQAVLYATARGEEVPGKNMRNIRDAVKDLDIKELQQAVNEALTLEGY